MGRKIAEAIVFTIAAVLGIIIALLGMTIDWCARAYGRLLNWVSRK